MDDASLPSREMPRRNSGETKFAAWKGALGYSLALSFVAVAFAVRLLLSSSLQHQAPYLFFAPAMLAAAALGGFGPGIAATALSLGGAAVRLHLAGSDRKETQYPHAVG